MGWTMTKYLKLLVLAMSIFGFLVVTLPVAVSAEESSDGWLTSDDIRFELDGENVYFKDQAYNNRDCTWRTLNVSEPISIFDIIKIGSADKTTVCGNYLPYGFMGGSYLELAGNNVAGEISKPNSYSLITADNLDKLITFKSIATDIGQLGIMDYLDVDTFRWTDISKFPKYKYRYTVKNIEQSQKATNSIGNQVTAVSSTIAFSANAKWMLFDSSGFGHVRLNTEDGTTMYFGDKVTYNQGWDPRYTTAISNDGRYAMLYSYNRDIFRVYDLENCQPNKQESYKSDCAFKDLEPLRVQQQLRGVGIKRARFVSDKEITYYTSEVVNNVVIHNKNRVTVGNVPKYGYNYLALGDSFASGEGAFVYRTPTDSKDNQCHLSGWAYPYLIGDSLSKNKYGSVACSGATLRDISESSEDYDGQYRDEEIQKYRNDINDILANLTTAKITQITFIERLKPESVTISVGGNDIGFTDKLTSCIMGVLADNTCFNEYSERAQALLEINAIIPELKRTYEQLKQNSGRVYVVGYPQLIDPDGNCAVNVRFNRAEADFANYLVHYLNEAIKTASAQAGVFYVDTEDVFYGHRLCETESEDTYVHGLTEAIKNNEASLLDTKYLQIDGIRVIGKESFHPKPEGHLAYQDRILKVTNNLTTPMPEAVTDTKIIWPAASDGYWQVIGYDGKPIRTPHKYDIMLDRMNLSESFRTVISAGRFMPNSPLTIEFHSDPVVVNKAFTSTADGGFDDEITIPGNIASGFHSIHILGQDKFGRNIDVYDYAWVGHSYEDFDGDGVPDKDEGCVFISPFGTDSDSDGIDDACDDYDDPAPASIADDQDEQKPTESLPLGDPAKRSLPNINNVVNSMANLQPASVASTGAQNITITSAFTNQISDSGYSFADTNNNQEVLGSSDSEAASLVLGQKASVVRPIIIIIVLVTGVISAVVYSRRPKTASESSLR